ncbi:50S ribosomal subunit protein L7/L12 [Candidatus Nasuia deltocephalinicola]|uniref:50S ribosomal protein L7/L12 n=1 Tax=Candidatus Nasuia deltocephalincola TaxID=1160784 RepID=A0A974WMX6_9PROT|nr:50S ribosomal protein L7/L12 [Candidatus Nasuia deltocephalinicola]BEH03957.1 50S ribosomal subunit protein L7/L12 [Candidatus Nasuia deltocephalinicola]
MNIVKNVLNLIENMTILELNNFIENLENKYKFNNNIDDNYEKNNNLKTEEKAESYSLYLTDFGKNKVSVIKIVKELNNLNLKEAKDLVESSPSILKKNLDLNSLNLLKDKLEKVGAKVKIEKENV